ncbi:MAG: hypothetical protein ACJ77E_17040 [Gaiellaceae bacterium]
MFSVAFVSGHAAAALARVYRRLLRVRPQFAPIAMLASVVVLVLWAVPRLFSHAAVACCVLVAGEHGRAQMVDS